MLVSIPSYGLGDVLYNTLALKILKNKTDEDVVIFCPQNCDEIPKIIKIPYISYYSKLFKLNSRLDYNSEKIFWSSLYKFRNNRLFSTLNDVVDKTISFLFNYEIVNEEIGNYYYNHPFGIRGKLNRLLKFRVKDKSLNPKHIIERYCVVMSSMISISEIELCLSFRKTFLDSVACLPKKNTHDRIPVLLIFPDAGSMERNITESQIRFIVSSYIEIYNIEIFSSRKFNLPVHKRLILKKFGSLADSFQRCTRSTLIFTSDSFPAHFAGLFGVKTFVLYNNPKINKYCEYWGSPYDNVYHIENGVIYKLNKNFTAEEIKIFELDDDSKIALNASNMDN